MPAPKTLFDPFSARDTFETGAGRAGIYRLSKLEQQGLGKVSSLPFSIRVLLEAVLRNCDGYVVTEENVKSLAGWNAAAPAKEEVPFHVSRVVMQDFTGVPAVVDLAAMRSAMKRLGGDPKKVNPSDSQSTSSLTTPCKLTSLAPWMRWRRMWRSNSSGTVSGMSFFVGASEHSTISAACLAECGHRASGEPGVSGQMRVSTRRQIGTGCDS